MWILDLTRIAERCAMVARLKGCAIDWRLRSTNIACEPDTVRVTIEFVDSNTGLLIDWSDASIYRK